jgi:hypothetical protein
MGAAWPSTSPSFWRDTEGRGAMLGGALDGPQLGAIVLVLAGRNGAAGTQTTS